jgi:RNA polymerase sigma factor (sigma-70 family)
VISEAERSLTDGYRYLVADKQRLLVVYGALKYRGIYRHHQDFDDLAQQAMGWYAEAYRDFPGSPEKDQSSFAHYAFQRIDWHLKDRFKRQIVRDKYQCCLDDGLAANCDWLVESGSDTAPIERATAQQLWRRLWPYLTPKENSYLRCVIERGLNNKEIAEQWHTSPQAVSYVRQRVIKKARAISSAPNIA